MIEFKKWLTALLINWAFDICPYGSFKVEFAKFLSRNINNL